MAMNATRATLVLSVACVTLGCYSYVPRERATLTPATYVALTLMPFETEEMHRNMGPNVGIVRGRFLSITNRGAVAVSVLQVETRRGNLLRWGGERVEVPPLLVRRIEERRVAPGKMAILAAATIAGYLAVHSVFDEGAGGTSGGAGVRTTVR